MRITRVRGIAMRTEKWNDLKHVFFLVLSALFLTVSFFVVMSINADDAGTYMLAYWQYELGSLDYNILQTLDPWNLTLSLLYHLGIGNTGTDMAAICFSIWYFLCIFTMLVIVSKQYSDNKWLLAAVVFIMIPSSATNKYHTVPAFAALLMLWAIEKMVSERKKIPAILAAVFSLFVLLTVSDKALLLMSFGAPAGLYAFIWALQKKERHVYLYAAGGALALVLACLNIVSGLLGLSLFGEWGGYGGSDYMYWTDMHTLFDKGIPSFFAALLNQYNIPLKGGFVKLPSVFWLIRIGIVGLMLVALISRWCDIIKRGIEKVPVVDVLCVLCATSLIGVNVLSGIAELYSVGGAPINRYAGLAWFLLVIVCVRWVEERFVSYWVMPVGRNYLSSGAALGLIFVLLIVGYSNPIYKGRESLVQEPCQSEIDFLETHDSEYKCGLASYWKTNPITAATNGKYNVCMGWIRADEVDSERLYLECKGDRGWIYRDGSNYFNFIISHSGSEMTMEQESIEAIRGDFADRNFIYGSSGESVIYLYDYDIRWDPQVIMEAVGTDYELTDPIEYHFADLTVGTNRVELEVSNSANFNLAIADNEDVADVSVQVVSDNKIYVDFVCTQNTDITFKAARSADEMTTIHKIQLKHVRGAVEADTDEIFLKEGSYVITFQGSGLRDEDVAFEGITAERLTDGDGKSRYLVQVGTPQTVRYSVSGDAVVEHVFYENQDLRLVQ